MIILLRDYLIPNKGKVILNIVVLIFSFCFQLKAVKADSGHNIYGGISVIPGGSQSFLSSDHYPYIRGLTTGHLLGPGAFASYEYKIINYFSLGISFDYYRIYVHRASWEALEWEPSSDVLKIPIFIRGILPLLEDSFELFLTAGSGINLVWPCEEWYNTDESKEITFSYGFMLIDISLGLRYWFTKSISGYLDGGCWFGGLGIPNLLFLTGYIRLGVGTRF